MCASLTGRGDAAQMHAVRSLDCHNVASIDASINGFSPIILMPVLAQEVRIPRVLLVAAAALLLATEGADLPWAAGYRQASRDGCTTSDLRGLHTRWR